MPLEKNASTYQYPRCLPSQGFMAKLLGVYTDEVQILRLGQVQGISRKFVEDYLEELDKKEDWTHSIESL